LMCIKARDLARDQHDGMTSLIVVTGRLLFALIFVGAAPRHFSGEGIHHAAELGVPFAGVLVPLSGVLAIVGGASVALGYRARWGAWALVVFLVPITFSMHAFWLVPDQVLRHVQLAMFTKNLSMIGAALWITQLGAGPWSIDARRRCPSEVAPGDVTASSRSGCSPAFDATARSA
jgi:putative oxidoreductase